MSRKHSRGFTLVELLVVLTVIALLIGLLLPAIQAAREASRRANCANHLKQLALGLQNYHDVHQVFPLGSYMMPPPGNPFSSPASGSHEHSLFARILPQIEQAPLYSSFNASVHYMDSANTTLSGVALSVLWCPSDPIVREPVLTRGWPIQHTNYMGNAGPWSTPGRFQDRSSPTFTKAYEQAMGIFYFYSKTSISAITDGTSQTMLLGESFMGKLSAGDRQEFHWWSSGNYSDSMCTTRIPINPFNKFLSANDNDGADTGIDNRFASAISSGHPGGANVAFCDGSVKFLRDSIQTMPYDPMTGLPLGISVDRDPYLGNLYTKTAPFGIYQALSTRSGGEVISADAY